MSGWVNRTRIFITIKFLIFLKLGLASSSAADISILSDRTNMDNSGSTTFNLLNSTFDVPEPPKRKTSPTHLALPQSPKLSTPPSIAQKEKRKTIFPSPIPSLDRSPSTADTIACSKSTPSHFFQYMSRPNQHYSPYSPSPRF